MFMRPIFTWKYSGVLIPFFFGMGYAAMTYHQFVMAYALSALGGIWTLGYYIFSDSRKKRSNTVRKLRDATRKHEAVEKIITKYRHARNWHYCKEIGTYAAVLLATGCFVFWLNLGQEEYELSLLEGKLYPANEAIPENDCEGLINKDSLMMFMGPFIAVSNKFPTTIVEINDYPFLSMDKHEDGSLAISMEIRSDDGRIIVQVVRGMFTINPNNYIRKARKDRSSLEVTDQYGQRVLNARFFNPRAIWIDASLPELGWEGKFPDSPANQSCLGSQNGKPMIGMKISGNKILFSYMIGKFPFKPSN